MNAQSNRHEDPMQALARIGIKRPEEALLTMPRRYIDYTLQPDPTRLADYLGQKVAIELKVISSPKPNMKQPRFTVEAMDRAHHIHNMMVFGSLKWSPWKSVKAGDIVKVYAKVGEFNGVACLNDPALIRDEDWGHVLPVYRSVPGRLAGEKLATSIRAALEHRHAVEDAVLAMRQAFGGQSEAEIRLMTGLKWSLSDVVRTLHEPTSMQQAEWAVKAARKLSVHAIRYRATKAMARPFQKESVIRIAQETLDAMIFDLPFRPTCGELSQEAAIQKIVEQLAEPYPMECLLSADVGNGKTLVYMLPAVAAQKLGRKVAVMIPNSILVEQVATEFRECFPGTPVVTIGDAASARGLDLAQNPILIGTTGLIGAARARSWIPDFLVIDESQKTSREQREALRGPHTNVLEATATALPRTLALVTHGGKMLIQVAKHHAKKQIDTRVVTSEHRKEIMVKIQEVMAAGGQVAIIYPRVAGQSDGDKMSVEEAGKIWEQKLPGQVAILHGKMKDIDKMSVMAEVKAGHKSLLCASSIIEIGATIKNLKLLMVVGADRYGVSTLHQMRGRLVRHGGEGFCYLYLTAEIEEETMDRLKLMEKASDGFKLAEMDMALRGFGDLSEESEDQSGASFTLFRDLTLMPEDFES